MKKTIPVIGMACASCSANVERKLNSLDGINNASVSLAGRTALVDYDPQQITLDTMKKKSTTSVTTLSSTRMSRPARCRNASTPV